LWIPLYESNNESAKSVIATFFQVFPNGILFSNDLNKVGYDAVLLGQVEPAKIDLDRLQGRLNSESYSRVRQSLMDVGFGADVRNISWGPNAMGDPMTALLATYAGRAADLGEWMKGAQINTDRNLRLQYLAGMALNSYIGTEILNGILKYYKYPDEIFAGSADRLQTMRQALQYVRR